MRIALFSTLALLAISVGIKAQNHKHMVLINAKNNQPIADAMLLLKKTNQIIANTMADGSVEIINNYSNADTILVYAPGFQPVTFTIDKLQNIRHESNSFFIEMSPSGTTLKDVVVSTAIGKNTFRAFSDLDIQLQYKQCALGASIQNIFNTKWKETHFDTEGSLKNETTSVEEIHFTRGTPFSALFPFSYYFH